MADYLIPDAVEGFISGGVAAWCSEGFVIELDGKQRVGHVANGFSGSRVRTDGSVLALEIDLED